MKRQFKLKKNLFRIEAKPICNIYFPLKQSLPKELIYS